MTQKTGSEIQKKAAVFEKTYREYLDMECLAIGGTFLSGILIGKK